MLTKMDIKANQGPASMTCVVYFNVIHVIDVVGFIRVYHRCHCSYCSQRRARNRTPEQLGLRHICYTSAHCRL